VVSATGSGGAGSLLLRAKVAIATYSVEVTPPNQSGGIVAHHRFPNRGPLRKVSGLLIRQMNSQVVNIGVHAVQVKGKKPMASFAGTDILPIEVILDFIPGGRHIVPIGPTCSRLRRCSW